MDNSRLTSTGTSDFAIITFSNPSLASYDGHFRGLPATIPIAGQKLDLNSPAALLYSNFLAGERGLARAWLARNAPEVQVVYDYSVVLNGLAVKLNGHSLDHLLSMPGVSTVTPSSIFRVDMNRSPTLIGAPVLWNAVGGQSDA